MGDGLCKVPGPGVSGNLDVPVEFSRNMRGPEPSRSESPVWAVLCRWPPVCFKGYLRGNKGWEAVVRDFWSSYQRLPGGRGGVFEENDKTGPQLLRITGSGCVGGLRSLSVNIQEGTKGRSWFSAIFGAEISGDRAGPVKFERECEDRRCAGPVCCTVT